MTTTDQKQEKRLKRFVEQCLGPRQVGGRYLVDGQEVTVLAVNRDTGDWRVWSVTEATDAERAVGHSRTHCTRWEYDRPSQYRVITDPDGSTPPDAATARPTARNRRGARRSAPEAATPAADTAGTAGGSGRIGAGLAGETVGLDQSIAYARGVSAQATEHGTVGGEGYLGHLTWSGVSGPALRTARQMQAAFDVAAATSQRHAEQLQRQKAVQEQYDANPDAGDKNYQQEAGR